MFNGRSPGSNTWSYGYCTSTIQFFGHMNSGQIPWKWQKKIYGTVPYENDHIKFWPWLLHVIAMKMFFSYRAIFFVYKVNNHLNPHVMKFHCKFKFPQSTKSHQTPISQSSLAKKGTPLNVPWNWLTVLF